VDEVTAETIEFVMRFKPDVGDRAERFSDGDK
jgi:hypothetical protein